MKTTVVLRHAQRQDRTDNQSHLSQAGIGQARAAGRRFERFDLVVTSALPRAIETAVAMGFAVNRTHPAIQDIGQPILEQVNWDAGFTAWAAAYTEIPLVKAYADYTTALLSGWLQEVPDGGSMLVVSHGGIVECLAVGLRPDADWGRFGPVAGYTEGFSATLQPSALPDLTVIRS